MSLTRRCDLAGCSAVDDELLVSLTLKDGERYDFCQPEHVVVWLFEQCPSMPLWYGPKTKSLEQAMAEAMNG